MKPAQKEIEKISNIIEKQLQNKCDINYIIIRNGDIAFEIYHEISLFELNEIQNQIEGWDIHISNSYDFVELIFRRH